MALLSFNTHAVSADETTHVCERHIISAAHKHGVPVALLYAVGQTESGRGGRLHPFALNSHGRTFFPKNSSEADRIIMREQRDGRYLIDVGCMQINLHYHQSAFPSLDAMFDPGRNVDYAAKFLKRLKSRHGSWTVAVARYHAGAKNHSAQKNYVCKVLRKMIEMGAATHTKPSNNLCNSML